jgi:acetoin utilization protein AcuC
MIPHFYLHPDTYKYDFGPQHPLKPERLKRTMALIEHYAGPVIVPSDHATDEDLLRIHTPEYISAVARVDFGAQEGILDEPEFDALRVEHGFFGDNPPFKGMSQAARAYAGASIAAAQAVKHGAPLAFGIGGGLHHALADKASGFCIYNDCALAISVLREKYQRVAYIDIDVHHGDGVQWIFYDDPTVLTCSIHQDGRTLYPGTGGVQETGKDFTSLNVPLEPGTTGDVWLWAFREGILPHLQKWQPQAIVLQIGADTHYLDPLARIDSTQQEWLEAIQDVQALNLPMVVLGGGGYELSSVPRMWAGAVLTLTQTPYEDQIPSELAQKVGAETYSDHTIPGRERGRDQAEWVVRRLKETR